MTVPSWALWTAHEIAQGEGELRCGGVAAGLFWGSQGIAKTLDGYEIAQRAARAINAHDDLASLARHVVAMEVAGAIIPASIVEQAEAALRILDGGAA